MPLIKPELLPASQDTENPPYTEQNPTNKNVLPENNNKLSIQKSPSILINTNNEDKDIVIRKKREFKIFLRLIKQGKFTSAMITSKILGVNRMTIQSWLSMPRVKEAMNTEVNTYVNKISSSKDWKAQAYLLDKTLEHNDKDNISSVNLTNLIQINTVSPT